VLRTWPSWGTLAQARRGIRSRRKGFYRRLRSAIGRDFCRSGLCHTNTGIPVKMILRANRAVTFAGIFIPLAGQGIATAYAVAVAGLRSGLYGYECHGASPAKDSMRRGRARIEKRGRKTRKVTLKLAPAFPSKSFLVPELRRNPLRAAGFSAAPDGTATQDSLAIRSNAPPESIRKLRQFSDRIVCLRTGESLRAHGAWAEHGGRDGR
jgi:hypothetical protein